MVQVDEALASMKHDFKGRMDTCDERRKVFEAKQAKLRDQVVKFEKFILENDQKRLRAEAKVKIERSQLDQKSAEMTMMIDKIGQLEVERANTLTLLGQ
jgi:hypothetical protein